MPQEDQVLVTNEDLLAIIGVKEAELYGLRRRLARLTQVVTELTQQVADLEANPAEEKS